MGQNRIKSTGKERIYSDAYCVRQKEQTNKEIREKLDDILHLTAGQRENRCYDLIQEELGKSVSSYSADHRNIISRIADRIIHHDLGRAVYSYT